MRNLNGNCFFAVSFVGRETYVFGGRLEDGDYAVEVFEEAEDVTTRCREEGSNTLHEGIEPCVSKEG